MTTASAFAAVLVVGLFTYASRVGLILTLADRTLRPETQRALGYVAPAVLTALVVTFTAGGEGLSGITWTEVGALSAGAVASKVSGNLVVGLVAGMTVLWGLTYLSG